MSKTALLGFAAFILWSSNIFAASCADSLLPPLTAEQEWQRDYPNLEIMYRKSLQLEHGADHPVLSVVIPAFREEKRIAASIAQIRSFFDRYPISVEVLVRIEKSPDQTVPVAEQAAAGDARIEVADHGVQRGKGFAVRQGMLRASGDYVLFMDTDLSTPLPEIFHFLSAVVDGNASDVIIGDRHHPDSQIEANQSFHRQVMGATFRGLIRSVLSSYGLRGIADTQCGFKMFTRQAAQTLFTLARVDGFAFDIEILLMASELGMKISPLPVIWRDDPRTTVHPIRDPIKMLLDVIKMKGQVRAHMQGSSTAEKI